MALEWTDVSSSQLAAIGYDAETMEARVRFQAKGSNPGSVYSYKGVPPEVVTDIINAESPGRQFSATLKYGYQYEKIG